MERQQNPGSIGQWVDLHVSFQMFNDSILKIILFNYLIMII